MPNNLKSDSRRQVEAHLDLVERILRWTSRRYRFSTQDAEELRSVVFLKLVEDDCAVFRKFRGRSSLRTYLTTVIQRLALDYRNKVWGKWRPSRTAKRLGEEALVLERLMNRDGHSAADSIEMLKRNHGVELSRRDLEAIVARLPNRRQRRFESGDVALHLPTSATADRELWQAENIRVVERVQGHLGLLLRTLPREDRQILELRFGRGLQVSQIARDLELDQRSLYSRIDRCLRRLKRALEAAGVSGQRTLEAISDL